MSVRSQVRQAVEHAFVALPRRTHHGDRLVLAYHNVVPADAAPHGDRSLHLSADVFRAQLRAVRNEADIVPLMDLLTRESRSERRVAITFDDAYDSALRLGVGECVTQGVASTVFVAPGLLGTVPPWDIAAERGAWNDADREHFLWQQSGRATSTDEAAMTVAEQVATQSVRIASADVLRTTASHDGVTLGNHTMRHPNLGSLSTNDVRRELADADEWLRGFLPKRLIPVVAYPYGHAPSEPLQAVQPSIASYGMLVTGKWVSRAESPSPLAFPRWNVPAGMSARGFRSRLRGWMASR